MKKIATIFLLLFLFSLHTLHAQFENTEKKAQFKLTKDLNTFTGSVIDNTIGGIGFEQFVVLNNAFYFQANDISHGDALWRSDGTKSGTYIVKDFYDDTTISQRIRYITATSNKIFFSAYTKQTGFELWASDGTTAGTYLVKDIIPGVAGSYPRNLCNVNNEIYFTLSSALSTDNQLWKTDGTPGGTVLIRDISNIEYGNGIKNMTVLNEKVFFTANTNHSYTQQLFLSDGTYDGTKLIHLYSWGYFAASPRLLTPYHNKLYFEEDGYLCVSDGTDSGTQFAPGTNDVQIFSQSANTQITILNDYLLLEGRSTYSELYKYNDKNNEGLSLVADFVDSSNIIGVITNVNDKVFFLLNTNDGTQLWVTKGKQFNTSLVKNLGFNSVLNNGASLNGDFYFTKFDTTYGYELWKSDGTETGTVIVKDIYPGRVGSFPSNMTQLKGKIYFTANQFLLGRELMETNGSNEDTKLLKEINKDFTESSKAAFERNNSILYNQYLLFSAKTYETGTELFRSDGSSGGTQLVKDLYSYNFHSSPKNFKLRNNLVYFQAVNGLYDNGSRILSTNGKDNKTIDVIPPEYRMMLNYDIAKNGLVYYIVSDFLHPELWRSDGTISGTYLLKGDIHEKAELICNKDTVYFCSSGGSGVGYELWKSDGTVAGTKMIKDIGIGFLSSYPHNFAILNKQVYFGISEGGEDIAGFWKTDGTKAGTVKISNAIPPNANYPMPGITSVIINGILYFNAFDQGNLGLWRSDGTALGTSVIKYFGASGNGLFIDNFTDVNGTLFFTLSKNGKNVQLWKSNGTYETTVLVIDLESEISGNGIEYLCKAGDKIYFTVDNLLWISNGKPGNAKPVRDKGLDDVSNIRNLKSNGSKLFFSGYTLQYGNELYAGDFTSLSENETAKPSNTFQHINANDDFDIRLTPNPVHSTAVLKLSGSYNDALITISDMTGKVISHKKCAQATEIVLPTGSLAQGMYILTVTCGEKTKQIKFVKD